MKIVKNGTWGKTARFITDVVAVFDSDECLLWPFGVSKHGYGMAWRAGKVLLVHRIICTDHHGDPPSPTHQAAHSCGKKLCCNPRHIRWATRVENEADKWQHGTRIYGERHVGHKLTEQQVLEIRRIGHTVTLREHSERYGVSQGVVGRIIMGRAWPYAGGAAA